MGALLSIQFLEAGDMRRENYLEYMDELEKKTIVLRYEISLLEN